MKIPVESIKKGIHYILNSGDPSKRELAEKFAGSQTYWLKTKSKVMANPAAFTNVLSMSDSSVKQLLRPPQHAKSCKEQPDFAALAQIGKKHGLNKTQLSLIYQKQAGKRAYRSTTFFEMFAKWESKNNICMAMDHEPGKVAQVDFAGKKYPITVAIGGENKRLQCFAAVFPFSGFAFLRACETQNEDDFQENHCAFFEYIQRVPPILVPDNLKAAVSKAGRFPVINRLYEQLSRHYGFAIDPTLPYAPQQKAAVELFVRHAYQYVYARLNGQSYNSIDELNSAILRCLDEFNDKPLSQYDGTRRTWFEKHEKDKLLPLNPKTLRYYVDYRTRKVPSDYHIFYNKHKYSVPFVLKDETVVVLATKNHIYVIFDGKEVASHLICRDQKKKTTDPSHRHPHHAYFDSLDQSSMIDWSEKVGPNTAKFCAAQFEGKRNGTNLAKRTCSDIKKLAKKYGNEQLERAAGSALSISASGLRTLKTLLRYSTHHEDKLAQLNMIASKMVTGSSVNNHGEQL